MNVEQSKLADIDEDPVMKAVTIVLGRVSGLKQVAALRFRDGLTYDAIEYFSKALDLL